MLNQRCPLPTEIQYGTEQGTKNLRSEGGTGWKLGVYEGMNCQDVVEEKRRTLRNFEVPHKQLRLAYGVCE